MNEEDKNKKVSSSKNFNTVKILFINKQKTKESNNSLLNIKRKRNKSNVIKKNIPSKDSKLNKYYISLINNEDSTLIKTLKCEEKNLPKAEFANNSDLSFEIKKIFNKGKEKIQIKLLHAIQFKNKSLIFLVNDENLLIYEQIEEPFSLTLVKTILKKEFFENDIDSIKYFFCFTYKNYIIFDFFSLRQIKLFIFNPNSYEFILKKKKDYSNNVFQKFFYYMKQSKKIIIYRYDEVTIYSNTISTETNLLEFEEDENSDQGAICYCKELGKNILSLIYNNKISLYSLELDKNKLIGSIKDINPRKIKLINYKKEKYLLILCESNIYMYDFKTLNLLKKIELHEINNIRNIKYFPPSNIAILYGDYNFAIYDLYHDFIRYRIKNDSKYDKYQQYYFLKKLNEFTLLYNPKRNCLNAINFSKGQTLAEISDGNNIIIKCKQIPTINIEDINEEKRNKYYFIINIKGYFILKVKKC